MNFLLNLFSKNCLKINISLLLVVNISPSKKTEQQKRVLSSKKAISILCYILNYCFVTIFIFTATELKTKALFKTVRLCENYKMWVKFSKESPFYKKNSKALIISHDQNDEPQVRQPLFTSRYCLTEFGSMNLLSHFKISFLIFRLNTFKENEIRCFPSVRHPLLPRRPRRGHQLRSEGRSRSLLLRSRLRRIRRRPRRSRRRILGPRRIYRWPLTKMKTKTKSQQLKMTDFKQI
jgi:hypothetical protein